MISFTYSTYVVSYSLTNLFTNFRILTLLVNMGDAPNSFNRPPAPPPQHFPNGSDMTMLYYGLVIVVSAAILLAVYNLIFIRWCLRQPGQPRNLFAAATDVQSFDYPSRRLLSSFRYKKESSSEQDQGGYQECAVCLSVFEDGEELRELPRCKHSFHAPCIDMWLYSHSDCPICRARVGPSMQCHQEPVANSSPVISRELLIMEPDNPV